MFFRFQFRAMKPQVRAVGLMCLFLVCLLLPLLQATAVQAAMPDPPLPAPQGLSDTKELSAFLNGVMSQEMQANNIPGATVSVVKNGKVFFSQGYGDANVEQHKPVTANETLFRIGSVSKLFTWTAIMQLVEQGKIDLHSDVNKYLKTFQIPATYAQPITMENLLTHTAGFEDRGANIFVQKPGELQPLGTWLANNMPARVRPPGVLAAYSNYGATLAGYIVQQVSGEPYAQYIDEHIFKPLHMASSSFEQPLPGPLAQDVAQGYSYENGNYVPRPFELLDVPPAGSMSSTANDMAKFMIAHLQNGQFGDQRILQTATAQEMHSTHFAEGVGMPGIDYGFYNRFLNNQRIIMHEGDTLLFHSLLALIPDQNVGIFVSYSSAGGNTARTQLLQAFMDHYFASQLQTANHPAGFASRANQIVGTYWLTRHSYTTFEKVTQLFSPALTISDAGNSRLILSAGGTTQTVEEISPWVFRSVSNQGLISFQQTQDGMTAYTNSAPTTAYVKVPWYDSSLLHLGLIGLCLLLFVSAIILWPITGIVRIVQGRRRKVAPGTGEQELIESKSVRSLAPVLRSLLSSWVGWLLCVVDCVLVLLVLSLLSNSDSLVSTSPILATLFTVAFISFALTVIVVLAAVFNWVWRSWSVGWRVYYTLIVLAAIGFAWEIFFWNLYRS